MKLSIVILNFNTKELTVNCINSIFKNGEGLNYEIIVVDNASTDGSQNAFKKVKKIKVIENDKNLGFSAGNNVASKVVKGEYVLFLNSDTEVNKGTLQKTVKYLDENSNTGAMTVKMFLADGKLDKDARRSIPTPWVTLSHFSGLDRVFPKSKVFARYWYGYKSPNDIQEVEVFQGAFFMVRKEILDKVGWFDEDYFLNGEDIDLSWKIKNLGYKLVYYPEVTILHIKKASKKKSLRAVMAGVNAMEIFYKKRQWQYYPLITNLVVILAIYLMKILRIIKAFV